MPWTYIFKSLINPTNFMSIRGKVVASFKFGLWWVLWIRVCPWLIRAPKVFQLRTNQLVVWFVQVLVNLPNPHPRVPARPSTLKVLWVRERAPTPSPSIVITFGLAIESIKELGGASTSMLSTTTISIPMVIIPTSSDWINPIPTFCLWVSTIVVFNTIGGVVLIQDWWCSSLWLPIGIFYGAKCGFEYSSGFLLLVWIDGQIYLLISWSQLASQFHAFQFLLDYRNFWFLFLWLIH